MIARRNGLVQYMTTSVFKVNPSSFTISSMCLKAVKTGFCYQLHTAGLDLNVRRCLYEEEVVLLRRVDFLTSLAWTVRIEHAGLTCVYPV